MNCTDQQTGFVGDGWILVLSPLGNARMQLEDINSKLFSAFAPGKAKR